MSVRDQFLFLRGSAAAAGIKLSLSKLNDALALGLYGMHYNFVAAIENAGNPLPPPNPTRVRCAEAAAKYRIDANKLQAVLAAATKGPDTSHRGDMLALQRWMDAHPDCMAWIEAVVAATCHASDLHLHVGEGIVRVPGGMSFQDDPIPPEHLAPLRNLGPLLDAVQRSSDPITTIGTVPVCDIGVVVGLAGTELIVVHFTAGAARYVRIWRDSAGRVQANVEHVRSHSTSGFDVGTAGPGPADLALSILHALYPPASTPEEEAAGWPDDDPRWSDGLHTSDTLGKLRVSERASVLHEQFTSDFLVAMDPKGGSLTYSEIEGWAETAWRTYEAR